MSADAPKARRSLRETVARARSEHRLRHTPTGMRFALADSIEFLDRGLWERATSSASVFFTPRYLRALESAPPEGLQPRYALICAGSTPVAAVVAQIVRVRGERVTAKTPSKEIETKRARVLEAVRAAGRHLKSSAVRRVDARVLVCGNLLCWGQHGVAFAPGVEPREAWPAVAEALYRIRRAERLAGQTDVVVVKDLASEHMDAARALEPLSYRPLETDPDMVLELDPAWRSFDDYLASLSAKYRKSARAVLRDVESARCSLDAAADVSQHADRLHQLYLQVHERAAVRPVTISSAYLPALASALGDDFRCTLARREGEVVGFVTTLRDRDTAIGYYIGFDAAANAELPLYFRLLQAVVADALELGCRRISLGRTALEPKARLGAKPQPLHVWMRHRVPVANLLLRRLMAGVPHDEAPERNPFK